MTGGVVVVGDIAVDVVARFDGRLSMGSDTAAHTSTYGGGSAANVAAWLAVHTRVSPILIGRVGADAAGREQLAALRGAGVDVRATLDDERPTGCVIVLVDQAGERTMLPDRGASTALSADDLPSDVFVAGGHLHLSGYPLLHDSSRAGGLAALQLAQAAGMTVSIDPSSAAPLFAVGPQRFLEWTGGANLCIANLDEAVALVGDGPPEELARRLARSSYGEVVIKLGAQGAVWSNGTDTVSEPAVRARVVDTTGAGDAFAAGFLAAWLDGSEPRDALCAGTRLAARAVATIGGRPSIDSKAD